MKTKIVFDKSGKPSWVPVVAEVFTKADLDWFRKPLGK